MNDTICVCCGSPVRVVSGEDGSNSYESLAAERLRAVEADRDRLLVLFATEKSDSVLPALAWERALRMLEIKDIVWSTRYDQLLDATVSRGLALVMEGKHD